MGSINKSHNETDGGVLLFNGELILLYCDSVQCDIAGKESVKGRVYLTTHRLVMTPTPYRQNAAVKSLCAPFCAITKCSVEQPVFGANYIEAIVREDGNPSSSISFKLKFSKGGAIEFAMAMNRAVSAVGRNMNHSMPPPPAYTPSPTAQYYQAPPTVYAPGYASSVPMPTQQFPDQPPIGFIYASAAPPPYPGVNGPGQTPQQQQQQPPPPYSSSHQQAGFPGYPQQQQAAGPYPMASGYQQPGPQAASGYPQPGQQQGSGYPLPGMPPASADYPQPTAAGYGRQPPAAAGYPQPTSGYPASGQPAPAPGYPLPGQQQQQPPAGAAYPQPAGGYPQPGQQAPASVYPHLADSGYPGMPPQEQPAAGQQAGASWPSAPSFNPNWQEDKKSA